MRHIQRGVPSIGEIRQTGPDAHAPARSLPAAAHLVSCSIVACELTLSVLLGALLRVGVVDDAVAGARDDLLAAGVWHELGAEDVGPVTRADGLLDLRRLRAARTFCLDTHTHSIPATQG